ncbi:MAG: cytochrome c3 family protein [Candidatus Schekmanbacteria bacterium]|nr:cytochrome c3 family protein [Candidatus Schekmanbacteria bacterium]
MLRPWITPRPAESFLTSLAVGLAALLLVLVPWPSLSNPNGSPHDLGGDCATCHLNAPEAAVARGQDVLLVGDADKLCRRCHELEPRLTHPSGFAAGRKLPDAFPLDWAGRLTCSSCHYAHRAGKPDLTGNMLRAEKLGRDLCIQCHATPRAEQAAGRHSGFLAQSHLTMSPLAAPGAAAPIDEESMACVSCHDEQVGVLPQGDADQGSDVWDHRGVGFSHPIGVRYPTVGEEARGYRPLAQLDSRLRLFNGMITCLTCHEAYSTETHILTMPNRASDLCLSCHVK